MSRAVMCHVMGAADTWPPFFREDGYRGLMRQLQERGRTYKKVQSYAHDARDAEHFKRVLAAVSDVEALDFHGDISTLWHRCKETRPGKQAPHPHDVDEAALHGTAAHPHAPRCGSPSCGAAAHTMRAHLGWCVPQLKPVPTMTMAMPRPRPAVSAA